MQSPVRAHGTPVVPTTERRRRGRALDVMGCPTPDHQSHLPTPVTQRRKPGQQKTASTSLPTPQTLPRKRKAEDDDDDEPTSPPSPSGQTTFVLSHAAAAEATIVRRRPGLLFAQQMGLVAGPSAQPAKFGGRLGAGIGMGGGLRHAHGPKGGDDDNPFLVDKPPTTAPYVPPSEPKSPGAETRHVPQAIRLSAERSLSPHPKARPRQEPRMLVPDHPGPSSSTPFSRRRPIIVDEEDNPFLSKPGEVVRPRPTSEDHPLVTYVFRGAKKIFANPFVPPSTAYPPSQLDPTHPEYDAHPCPPPRLLWPTKDPSPPMTPRRRRAHDDEDDSESEDDFVEVEPRRGLLFGAAPSQKRNLASPDAGSSSKRPRNGL